jgi:DNA-binding SARP family transcriptional activator
MFVFLFGETRVEVDGRTIHARDLAGVKPRLLLEFLAVNAGQPVSKARLVDALWPDEAPNGAIATMETYISLLRRTLQPHTPAKGSVIRTVSGGYLLDTTRVTVDLHRFTELLDQATAAHDTCGASVMAEAMALVTGDLLASDPNVQWADQCRDQFATTLASACTIASGCLYGNNDFTTSITMARRALEVDPYAEEAARHLIGSLWRSGRRGEALREYDNLRRMLVDDLGVEPATATRDLHVAILLDDEVEAWPMDQSADEDELVLELVKMVRMMVREQGVEQARNLVYGLAAKRVA